MHLSIPPTERPVASVRSLTEFLSTSWIELRRAERYHVFLSLARFDLHHGGQVQKNGESTDISAIVEKLSLSVRVSDAIAIVDERTVVVLFPETSRQGAEVATRRLQGTIAEALGLNPATETNGSGSSPRTPSGSFAALGSLPGAQLSSYPDAAGARSIPDLLHELQPR